MSLPARSWTHRRTFHLLTALTTAGFALLYLLEPQPVRKVLVMEDSIVELLSAGLALAGFVISLLMLVRVVIRRQCRPWLFCVLPAFALFLFLEEISYGESYLHQDLPAIDGYKLHSAHDIAPYYFRMFRQTHPILAVAGLMLAGAAGVAVVARLLWRFKRRIYASLERHPFGYYLAVAFALLMLSQVFDLYIFYRQAAFFAEELIELDAALALLFAALTMRQSLPPVVRASPSAISESRPETSHPISEP